MDAPDSVKWVELLLDNWFAKGGINPARLNTLAQQFELAFHSVGLSIASESPLDFDYIDRVKSLCDQYNPLVYSEHLSFSESSTQFLPDLLPFPYTEKNLQRIALRIDQVQDYLGRQLLLENVSAYVSFTDSKYAEAEFLRELVKITGCGLLVDVNNIYVNQVNLGVDPIAAIDALPVEAIGQVHLGGHATFDGYLVDAHNNPPIEPVWALYRYLLTKTGPVATLIEWDNDLPAFERLMQEQTKAQTILDQLKQSQSQGELNAVV